MFDAAARDTYKLAFEEPGDYCHIIDEEFDNLPEDDEEEIVVTKKDLPFINLSSFKPRNELNPKIWINGKLNPRVRMRLLEIADDFADTLEIDWVDSKDVILTGSLANYNWSKYSDFDLHLLYDFNEINERTEFVKDYFDSKKNLWNNKHDSLKIYGFPVEVYVQDINEQHTASGVYSLERDKWLVKPESNRIKAIKLNKYFIKEKALKLMHSIDKLKAKADATTDIHEVEEIGNAAKALFDRIKGIRREALKNGSEMSSGNIIFKILRRSGHIGKLSDIKIMTYDKVNSIK